MVSIPKNISKEVTFAVNMIGTFYQTMDVKGRMSFPTKLRDILGGRFVVTRGFMGKCLFVYSIDSFDELTEKLRKLPLNGGLKAQRFFLASASEVEADKQGRILIPQPLRDFAGLEKDIVVAGVLDHAEIWTRADWDEYNANTGDEEVSLALGGV